MSKASEHTCRSCRSTGLRPFLDLGCSPIADALVSEGQMGEPDAVYPLEAAFCPHCSLVQILETLPPALLFCRNYPYYSSVSDSWLEHSRQLAEALIDKLALSPASLVVEIASNDGYLLRNFLERGIPVLGIDPANGPADAARKIGIETLDAFFSEELAHKLKRQGRRPDVIIANNVLAHVADTRGFVRGLRTLINQGGLVSIEVPYVRDLIENVEFDTIYHQHLCYFSVTSITRLLESENLFVQEVERLPTHGGSLRIYAGTTSSSSTNLTELLSEERTLGLDRLDFYADFAGQVGLIRDRLVTLLAKMRVEAKRVVGYGAAAKACTLLNYCAIGTDLLNCLVDRNQHKHDMYMAGVRIPIYDTDLLLREQPDYVLLLCWNLADEILEQQDEYRRRGGKFIIPLPELKIA